MQIMFCTEPIHLAQYFPNPSEYPEKGKSSVSSQTMKLAYEMSEILSKESDHGITVVCSHFHDWNFQRAKFCISFN